MERATREQVSAARAVARENLAAVSVGETANHCDCCGDFKWVISTTCLYICSDCETERVLNESGLSMRLSEPVQPALTSWTDVGFGV